MKEKKQYQVRNYKWIVYLLIIVVAAGAAYFRWREDSERAFRVCVWLDDGLTEYELPYSTVPVIRINGWTGVFSLEGLLAKNEKFESDTMCHYVDEWYYRLSLDPDLYVAVDAARATHLRDLDTDDIFATSIAVQRIIEISPTYTPPPPTKDIYILTCEPLYELVYKYVKHNNSHPLYYDDNIEQIRPDHSRFFMKNERYVVDADCTWRTSKYFRLVKYPGMYLRHSQVSDRLYP